MRRTKVEIKNNLEYLSGDFVANFKRLMDDLKEEQTKLDHTYERSVRKLVEMEVARLEEVAPMPFDVGTKVVTSQGRIGTVLSCPVDISVHEDESYHGIQYGPGKYFQMDIGSCWEDIVTCEGMIRRVTVEFEPTDIESDWGVEKVVETFWADELVKVIV